MTYQFYPEEMIEGIREWVLVESPTYHKAGVNRMMDLAEKEMIQEDNRADGDRAVCHIEHRPMKIADVDIQEIRYPAKPDSVDEVTDGSPEDQGKSGRKKWMGIHCLSVKIEYQACGQGGEDYKDQYS